MSVPPPDHLSPSGWNLWDDCPRRWQARYVDGIVEPSGWQAEVGTFAHRVLEELMECPGTHRTKKAARIIAVDLWRHLRDPEVWGERTPTGALDRGEITERDFTRMAWYAIRGLWALEDPTTVEVVATEEHVEVKIGNVPFVGNVDRIDRTTPDSYPLLPPGLLVIIDYKTGRSPHKKKLPQVRRQVALYALAIATKRGQPLEVAQAGSLLYLGADESIGAPTDSKARREAYEGLQAVWADINQACEVEEFPASTGPLCAYCPMVGECAEGFSHVRWRLSMGYTDPEAPGAKLVAALDAA